MTPASTQKHLGFQDSIYYKYLKIISHHSSDREAKKSYLKVLSCLVLSCLALAITLQATQRSTVSFHTDGYTVTASVFTFSFPPSLLLQHSTFLFAVQLGIWSALVCSCAFQVATWIPSKFPTDPSDLASGGLYL